MANKKKMSPAELAAAKKRSKIRAPIFALLSRDLGFTRVPSNDDILLYRFDNGERVFVVLFNEHDGLVNVARVDNPNGENVACSFKLDKLSFLRAYAKVSAAQLKQKAVQGVSEVSEPSPAFNKVAEENSAQLETQTEQPAARPW